MSISSPVSGPRPAARVTVRIGPADVGRRVSVRTRPGPAGATEAVGTLESWAGGAAGSLGVRRRDGSLAELRAADLVGGFVVPPEWGAYELQALAQQVWAPARTAPLGDWELRWSGGETARANSARVGADPATDLAAALDATRDFYAVRGGRPLLQTPDPSPFDEDLEAAGWPVVRRVTVLVTPTADLRGRAAPAVEPAGRTSSADSPDDDWVAAMDEPPDLRAQMLDILLRSDPAAYLSARDADGSVAGIARVAIARGSGRRARERWAAVTSVHTLPAVRRRGVATALMAAAADWAAARDAPRIALQVLEGNDAAFALYDRLGLTRHHDYVYRSPEPGDVP